MSILVKLFLTIFTSLFIVGCGGATPQPFKQSSEMPSWFLSEVPTDSTYFYGVGTASTKENAKSKALAQISSNISITVQSDLEMMESDTTADGYTQETKSNIKTSTENMKFTGVEIIDNAYVDGKFYTYLKVDRKILFNAQKEMLDSEYNKVFNSFNQMNSEGIFKVLKNSKRIEDSVDKIVSSSSIEILKSINPQFDSVSYRKKVTDIKTNIDSVKANAVVYIKSKNKLATYYKKILEKYISSNGIVIVSNMNNVRNKNNLLVIDVSVEAKRKNVKTSDPRLRGASFAAVTVSLTTKNSRGKIVAQNRVDVTNISKDGLEAAKIKTKKFEREIKRQGVLNILLKTTK